MISELENIECTRNSVGKYRRKYALTAKQKMILKHLIWMKNILTEALVNSATNASFIFSYTNSAKLRKYTNRDYNLVSFFDCMSRRTELFDLVKISNISFHNNSVHEHTIKVHMHKNINNLKSLKFEDYFMRNH